MVVQIVDTNSVVIENGNVIRAAKKFQKGEKKLKKIKVSGNYDKQEIINELEEFITENQMVEKHPDHRKKFEKHCDGWRGFIEYEETEEEGEEGEEGEEQSTPPPLTMRGKLLETVPDRIPWRSRKS